MPASTGDYRERAQSMKLAKIDHERCRETDATTYVWVPDDFTSNGLGIFIKAAQELYLKNEEELKKAPRPAAPGYEPNFRLHPNLTVAEVEAVHKVQVAEYKEWSKKRDNTRKTFSTLLSEVSNGLIKGFYDLEPDILAFVSWGHRHGTTIEYGETDTDICSKDFNAQEVDDGL
jgi:hypothetical protein